jgi:hypothetical protein
MKKDILEQPVDDYLQGKGYLTRHNIRFRPNNHGNHSDIDVIGYNPKIGGGPCLGCKLQKFDEWFLRESMDQMA